MSKSQSPDPMGEAEDQYDWNKGLTKIIVHILVNNPQAFSHHNHLDTQFILNDHVTLSTPGVVLHQAGESW